MKVILMYCNSAKSIKKSRKKTLKNMFSISAMKKLNEMNEEDLSNYFKQIDSDLNLKTSKEYQDMYLNYFLVDKKLNKLGCSKQANEIACAIENNTDIALTDNKNLNNHFINTVKNVVNKLSKIFNNKITKKLIFSAIAIALTFSCYRLEYSVAPCFAGEAMSSIETAFYYIRMISGIICFVCMTIEIVQNAVQGDVRVIWYVVAKYLAIMVAILSFRKIFNIIDGIFNG